MNRRLISALAAASFLASLSAPAKADPWWFLTGMVVGAVVAPAYGYPYGYRSGYAPVRATAPWAESLQPPPECHWAKVQHNGAWRHARICYDSVAQGPVPQSQFSDTIISK
jgi:hypothetical protein